MQTSSSSPMGAVFMSALSQVKNKNITELSREKHSLEIPFTDSDEG